MNEEFQPSDELATLVNLACTSALSDEQHRALEELLAADDGACDYYLQYCRLHAEYSIHILADTAVHDALQRARKRDDVGDQQAAKPRGHVRSPAPQNQADSAPRPHSQTWLHHLSRRYPLGPSIAAAVLVVGLLLTVMALVAPPFYRAMTHHNEPGDAPSHEVIGRLTNLHEATWGRGQVGTRPGAQLPVGHRMELVEGLAEVTFSDGVRVILDGPCQYVITGMGSGRLEGGKLTAKIPHQRAGFVIETPIATITDLGTEFGVEFSDRSTPTCQLYVFQGSVAVQANANLKFQETPTIVREGEGLSLQQQNMRIMSVAAENAAGRFRRELPAQEILPVHQWTFGDGKLVDDVSGVSGEIVDGAELADGLLHISGGRVAFADRESLRTSSFTVTGWLRLPQQPPGKTAVMAKEASGKAPASWGFELVDGLMNFFVETGDPGKMEYRDVLTQSQVPIGEWFHFAGVYHASTGSIRLFINGRNNSGTRNGEGRGQPVYDANELAIGRRLGSSPLGALDWHIDDIRIYDRVLEPRQVWDLAASGPPSMPEKAPTTSRE